MSYKNTKTSWNVPRIHHDVLEKNITFENIVQRGQVWDKDKKSLLIHSLIIGIPIPAIYSKMCEDKNGETIYDIMDGKQRLTTIHGFMNLEFVLEKVPPVHYKDPDTGKIVTVDVSRKNYNELPEPIKENINMQVIDGVCFTSLTEQEEKELFRRLNNGQPLAAKNMVMTYVRDLPGAIAMGQHELFKGMFPSTQFENKYYVAVIIKMYAMLYVDIDDIDFRRKKFYSIAQDMDMESSQRNYMMELFSKIKGIHDTLKKTNAKIARKIYSETHIVSLTPFFSRCMEDEVPDEDVAEWLISFYGGDSQEYLDYAETCFGVSNRHSSIIRRNNALVKSFNGYFSL